MESLFWAGGCEVRPQLGHATERRFFNVCLKATSSAHLQQSDDQTSVMCCQSDSQSVDQDRRAGPAAQGGPREKEKETGTEY